MPVKCAVRAHAHVLQDPSRAAALACSPPATPRTVAAVAWRVRPRRRFAAQAVVVLRAGRDSSRAAAAASISKATRRTAALAASRVRTVRRVWAANAPARLARRSARAFAPKPAPIGRTAAGAERRAVPARSARRELAFVRVLRDAYPAGDPAWMRQRTRLIAAAAGSHAVLGSSVRRGRAPVRMVRLTAAAFAFRLPATRRTAATAPKLVQPIKCARADRVPRAAHRRRPTAPARARMSRRTR
jgi:hypothetical protein